MLIAFLVLSLIVMPQTPAPALPDTPQGKRVRAYVDAFNTGEVKTYLAMQEQNLAPEILKKRPAEERSKMFDRLRGDFGTMSIAEVSSASAEKIVLIVPDKNGARARITFHFEAAVPFRITGIAVEVDEGGGQP